MTSSRLAAWLNQARCRLTANSERPALEAQLLAGHILQKQRSWVIAHPETMLEPEQIEQLDQYLQRLIRGEPLPYLLGRWEFYGLDLEVSPAVLIPRPETELLVELALDWLQKHPHMRRCVDVGTGSGCIAVAVAHHVSDLKLTCIDRSWQALQIARRNLSRHTQIEHIHLIQGHLTSAVRGPFDLICANLPYISTDKLSRLDVAMHEPRMALDGGEDGLELIRVMLADSPRLLAPHGLILLEIESGQGQSVAHLAQSYYPDARIDILPDYAGLPRLIRIAPQAASSSSPAEITPE